MRISLPLAIAVLPLAASSAQAGFFDRLRGSGSAVDAAAPPVPPSEPSLDAFGGSAGHATGVVQEPLQAGAPSVSRGEGAVKTAVAVPAEVATEPEKPFEGIEWRTKYYVIRPSELVTEGITLASILAFVALALLGKRKNRDQALSWWKANVNVLGEQFYSFTAKPQTASLTRGDPATYFAFASGRRNVSQLAVRILTPPRHDLPGTLYNLGYKLYDLSYIGTDGSISLEFDLPATGGKGGEEFVWALVRKHHMQELRESRFDLQAFTNIVEPTKELLPSDDFVLFSEAGVLNEAFLGAKKGEKVGFRELLDPNNADAKKALKWLRAVIIGDVVFDRPDEAVLEKEGTIPKSRKLTMLLTLPPASKAEETKPLLELALNLLDVLAGGVVPSEVSNRGKKRRAEVHALLLSESRKEAKEKSLIAQQNIRKKAEQDRLDKMSISERRKYEAKQKDKEMRKLAMKQQKK